MLPQVSNTCDSTLAFWDCWSKSVFSFLSLPENYQKWLGFPDIKNHQGNQSHYKKARNCFFGLSCLRKETAESLFCNSAGDLFFLENGCW